MEADNDLLGPPPRRWDAEQEDGAEFPQPDDDFTPPRSERIHLEGEEGVELQDPETPLTMPNGGDFIQLKPSVTRQSPPTPSSATRQEDGPAAFRTPPRSQHDEAKRLTLPSSAIRDTPGNAPGAHSSRHLGPRKSTAPGDLAGQLSTDHGVQYEVLVPYKSDGSLGLSVQMVKATGRKFITDYEPETRDCRLLWGERDEILKVDDEDARNMPWDIFLERLGRRSEGQSFKKLLILRLKPRPRCPSPSSIEAGNEKNQLPSTPPAIDEAASESHRPSPPSLATTNAGPELDQKVSSTQLEESVPSPSVDRLSRSLNEAQEPMQHDLETDSVGAEAAASAALFNDTQMEVENSSSLKRRGLPGADPSAKRKKHDPCDLAADDIGRRSLARPPLGRVASLNSSFGRQSTGTLEQDVHDDDLVTRRKIASQAERNSLKSSDASLLAQLETSEHQHQTDKELLQEQIIMTRQQLASIQSKERSLQQQLALANEDQSSLLKTVEEVTIAKETLQAEKDDLERSIASLQATLEASEHQYQKDVESLQEQINITRQELASTRGSKESLKQLLKSSEKDKSSLVKECRDLTTANEALHGEKNDLQSCNASLKEKLEVSEQQLASVLEDQSSLLKTVQELTTTNAGLQDEKDDLQSYSASLQAKLDVCEQQSASFQEDRSSLLEAVQELTTDKASLQAEKDDLQSRNASIQAQLKTVQRDSTLLQEQLEKSQQQRRDDTESFKSQLEEAQKQFQGKNAALQKQLEESQKQRQDDQGSFKSQLEEAQKQFQDEIAALQEQLVASQRDRAVLQAGLNRDASARAMLVPFLLSTNIPGYRLVSEEGEQLARGDGAATEAENGQGRSRNALPHPANEVARASRPGDSNPNRPAAPALNGADPDAPRQWWPFWNRERAP
jgi:hypothetical protein